MTITHQTTEALKSKGHFFAAGALSFALHHSRSYGCHYGMRSSLERDCEAFYRGYDAAAREAAI